jgi:hypothetical protein
MKHSLKLFALTYLFVGANNTSCYFSNSYDLYENLNLVDIAKATAVTTFFHFMNQYFPVCYSDLTFIPNSSLIEKAKIIVHLFLKYTVILGTLNHVVSIGNKKLKNKGNKGFYKQNIAPNLKKFLLIKNTFTTTALTYSVAVLMVLSCACFYTNN